MLRRPLTLEPKSRLAAWSARLGWFALAVAMLSIIVVRSALLQPLPALATFAAGLVFAGFAILLAFAAFVSIWRQGRTGLGRAVLGLILGCALLCYPAYLGYRAWKLPAIYDVTTDPASPPAFDDLTAERGGMLAYPAGFARLQRAAYPNISPLQYDASPRVVFDIVLNLIKKRRWRIVNAQAPSLARRDASIEAVAHSLIMGFPNDVAIRITPLGAGSRVDVRAASRHPWPDFGANASRVQALLDDIDDAVNAAPEPRQPPPPPKPATRQPARR